MRKLFLFAFILAIIAGSCKNNPFKKTSKKEIQVDNSINKKTSFNNLFIDSNAINSFLASHPEYQKYSQQYSDFYKLRNYQCAWFDSSGMIEQAFNFMNLIGNAVNVYNDSSLYNKQLENEVDSFKTDTADTIIKTSPDIVETELKLTGQFFLYASKVYKGADINIQELGWFIPRKKLDLSVLLDSLIANKSDIENSALPLSDAYKKLLNYLPAYRKIDQSGNWDSIAYPPKSLHKGNTAAVISTIKQKLFALGDLTESDTTDVFDSSLVTAVKNFQTRMGQKPDGVIGTILLNN